MHTADGRKTTLVSAGRLTLLVIVPIALGFALLATVCAWTVHGVRINGPLYRTIIDDKDLLADILPPPEYIVETHLLVHEMLHAENASRINALRLRIAGLEGQYHDRRDHWAQALRDADIRHTFLDASGEPALRYYRLYRERFLPLVTAGRTAEAQALLNGPMRNAYEEHRTAIDATVKWATASAAAREAFARDLVSRRILFMAVTVAALMCLTAGIAAWILRRTIATARTLRDSEESYRRQFMENKAAMLLVDPATGRITDANLSATAYYGHSAETLKSLTFAQLSPGDTGVSSPLTLAAGPLHTVTHRLADGSLRELQACASLIRIEGRPTVHVILQDVTERNRLAAELSEALRKAEAASVAKSEFLANMSHEIRTPMTAILGFTDVLAARDTQDLSAEEKSELVRTIQRNGQNLLAILNDILDLSKIEAGRMAVETIATSPVAAAEEVVSLLRVRAVGKGIDLRIDYPTPVPTLINSDPVRLRQILTNLVGNAIKFTEIGHVTLAVSCVPPTPAAGATLRFDVTDTGIGMTPDQCARVFEAFTQGDTSTTRKFGGTGLGLKISSSLARLLGGTLAVSSEPGKGSTFSFTLDAGDLSHTPFVHPDQITRADPDAAPLSTTGGTTRLAPISIASTDPGTPQVLAGVRILVAEDGPDNQKLVSFFLRRNGAEVTIAENGAVALEAVARADSENRPFHLILMDMQMPVLDGASAVKALRAQRRTVPILALTAHAMASDRENSLAIGCQDHLTKPIHRETLVTACAHWSRTGTPGLLLPPLPPPSPHSPLTAA